MIPFFIDFLTCLRSFFRSRCSLGLEILALRQQLAILKRNHPRPRLRIQDRIFWILLRRLWPAWSNVLVIVKPETVVAWHRAGFRLFFEAKYPGRCSTLRSGRVTSTRILRYFPSSFGFELK
jgi:putative transposase